MQGEGGIYDNVFANMPGAIIEAYKLRTTALNMRHGIYKRWSDFIYTEENITAPVVFPRDATDEPPFAGDVHKAFFDPVYEGRNGLEYFRDRMGYRLVLREANADESINAKDGTLIFRGKIQNVGFGNVINKKKVSVILQTVKGTHMFTAETDIDARDWLAAEDGNSRPDNTAAWRDLRLEIKLNKFGDVPPGEYDIYIKINDPKETSVNRRCIQFANHDIWNAELGANKIGAITVQD